jgi:hypothetical protein
MAKRKKVKRRNPIAAAVRRIRIKVLKLKNGYNRQDNRRVIEEDG